MSCHVLSCFSCSPSSRCGAVLPCGHTCQSLGHEEDLEHKSKHQCQVICNTVAPCGHICASLCHTEDKEHQSAYKCVIMCEGLLICGHPCGVEPTKNKRHGCGKHKVCLRCRNPTTESTPLTGGIQIETDSLGNTGRSSVSDNTIPSHECRFQKIGAKACVLKCRALLSCNHRCCKPCHSNRPHTVQDKCDCCLKTAEVHIERCSRTCNGMLCGHECFNADSGSTKQAGAMDIQLEEFIEPEIEEQVENLISGQPVKIIKTYIQPGHKCKLVGGVCQRECKTSLHCGHECRLKCNLHEEGPNHLFTEQCSFCSMTDTIGAVFSVLGIDHPKGSSFMHCSHHVKNYECEEICPGRPCGQPCDVNKPHHTCSDHITSGRVECLKRCSVHLSCGHRCARLCHLGDYVHQCTKKKCRSSLDPGRTVSESIFDVDDLGSSMSEPAEGDKKGLVSGRIESPSPGNSGLNTERSSAGGKTLYLHPHKCIFNRAGTCVLKCKAVLSCRHSCVKLCHSDTPHTVKDKCGTCSKTDEVQEELRRLHIDHPKGQPFAVHCQHNANIELCDQICSGLLCGHDHFGTKHTCSSHYGIHCREKCPAVLSCRHKCTRVCHLGDDNHFCRTPKCLNAISDSFKPAATLDVVLEDSIETEIGKQVKLLEGQPAEIAYKYIQPGHKCNLVEGVCLRACKTFLHCGHPCRLRCNLHEEGPNHLVTEKCSFCSRSDAMWAAFSALGIDHPKGSSFMHCSHHVKNYECEEICPGRPCGQPCDVKRPNHTCSDHIASGRIECRKRCSAYLPCGHLCVRQCHLGDYVHQCTKKKCRSSLDPGLTLSNNCKTSYSGGNEGCGSSKQNGAVNSKLQKSSELEIQELHIPGHKCKGRRCKHKCKAVLHCGHKCRLRCRLHENSPSHFITEKCSFCSRSDAMWAEFSLLGIDHPKGSPFVHCSHLIKNFECEEICPGRPCGQPCHVDNPNHTCSDHITSGRIECRERCSTYLPCGHLCARLCHLGDDVHQCTRKIKVVLACGHRCTKTCQLGDVVHLCEDCQEESTKESLPKAEQPVIEELDTNEPKVELQKSYIVFSCGHRLLSYQHEPLLHSMEKCGVCTQTDAVKQKFSDSGLELPAGPFQHCLHYVPRDQCQMVCEGWICGHPCGRFKKEHVCSDHVTCTSLTKRQCGRRCEVWLCCEHRCSKKCHIGDGSHECTSEGCCGPVKSLVTPDSHENSLSEIEFPSENDDNNEMGLLSRTLQPSVVEQENETSYTSVQSVVTGSGFAPKSSLEFNPLNLKICLRENQELNVKDSDGIWESNSRLGLKGDAIEKGHTCCKSKAGKCLCQCDHLFECNHICIKLCHSETSQHETSEKCDTCVRNDNIRSELCVRGIEHPKGTLYMYCSHYEKNFSCKGICSGKLCGHPCGKILKKRSHSCLDHVANNRCMTRCDVVLACGHRCTKICHLGDVVHLCEDCQEEPTKESLPKAEQPVIEELDTNEPKVELQKSYIVFSCGHGWLSYQHEPLLHSMEKCGVCTQTDAVKQKFSDSGLELPAGPFQQCLHYVPRDQCQMVCEGRICGHPCGGFKKEHVCSDHVTCTSLTKRQCGRRCAVWLCCGHRCSKKCHIGDDSHECTSEGCCGPVKSIVTPDSHENISSEIEFPSEIDDKNVGVSSGSEVAPKSSHESNPKNLKITSQA